MKSLISKFDIISNPKWQKNIVGSPLVGKDETNPNKYSISVLKAEN